MIDERKKRNNYTRTRLVRGADGHLRPEGRDTDIADIWAAQQRIRLGEAINEDRKKVERASHVRWLRGRLRKAGFTKASDGAVVFTLPMPGIRASLARLPYIRRSRRLLGVIALGVIVLVSIFYLRSPVSPDSNKGAPPSVAPTAPTVLGTQGELPRGEPEYKTLLPEGKNIEALGGWVRISPLDKEPVFAYVDTIEAVQINVSQQPLPAAFRKDVERSLVELAEQFGAHQKITVEGITAYIGTSERGPQSILFAKNDLLVLIKSSSRLSNEQWKQYIEGLR